MTLEHVLVVHRLASLQTLENQILWTVQFHQFVLPHRVSRANFGVIVFACVFGGAVLGISLRAVLPQDRLRDSQDAVKLGTGLVTLMAALVLGLLVTSARGFFETQNNEVIEMSSKVIVLDRVLATYGSGLS